MSKYFDYALLPLSITTLGLAATFAHQMYAAYYVDGDQGEQGAIVNGKFVWIKNPEWNNV
jgi:hypothetical protein